jgi:hypothetical protein
MSKTDFVTALDNTGIILGCGVKYSIPDEYESLLTSILAVYDLSNQNLTDDSEIIQTFLAKSDLSNIQKINLSGNPDLTNATLQAILKKMKNVKGVSLIGLTNLTSIDFISKGNATGIYELDLRDTPVTNLSNLETYGKSLKALIINNYDTDFSKIQSTISDTLYNASYSSGIYSWVYGNSDVYSYLCCGLCLMGDVSQYKFTSDCDKIYSIFIGSKELRSGQSGTLDLTVLPNLEKVYLRYVNFATKLSSSLTYYAHSYGFVGADLALCSNLEEILLDGVSSKELLSLNKLPNKIKLERDGSFDLSAFKKIIDSSSGEMIDCSGLLTLSIGYDNSGNGSAKVTSIDGIERATNLKELDLYNSKLSDISSITKVTSLETLYIRYLRGGTVTEIPLSDENGTLSNLKSLSIQLNTNFKKIIGLSDISTLTSVSIYSTSISDITGLSNNIGLTSLELHDNLISDLSELDKLIENCGGTVGFTSIDLSNNSLDFTSASGNDNVQTILNLYNAGCKNINISGNKLAESSKLQGISGITVE